MKKAKLLLAVISMSTAMSMTALAGEWKQDTVGLSLIHIWQHSLFSYCVHAAR